MRVAVAPAKRAPSALDVRPTARPPPVRTPPAAERSRLIETSCGVLYLALSVAMTVHYVGVVRTAAQTDYFWTHFNVSGAQSFLTDVMNAHVWNTTAASRPVRLFSLDAASPKDYSKPSTALSFPPIARRHSIMQQLETVSVAIAGLRSQSVAQSTRSLTCYCWLDFGQAWQVAHTAQRQERCRLRYADNGAVYMEPTLRNVRWEAWYNVWGPLFELAYGSAVRETAGGRAWLQTTSTARAANSVDDELRHWYAHNVTRYTLPWHNRNQGGYEDVVLLQNALQTFVVPLRQVDMESGPWSSIVASFGVDNDLYYASDANASLVRNATNAFHLLGESFSPEIWTGGYPDTLGSVLVHDTIGPFASIDLAFVVPPPALVATVADAALAWTRANVASSSPPNSEHTVRVHLVPPLWRPDRFASVTFFGGNPLCHDGGPQPYVQESIGFDDSCFQPHAPLAASVTAQSFAIAMGLTWGANDTPPLIAARVKRICVMTTDPVKCQAAMAELVPLVHDSFLLTPLASVHLGREMASLAIGLVQFAIADDEPTVLWQPLLGDKGDPGWTFFGWVTLVDWVMGWREVVALEGDVTTRAVMSKQYTANAPAFVDPLQLPTRFSFAVLAVIMYMAVVSMVVPVAALVHTWIERSSYVGRNLWFVNPVVGVVYIGRPLMIVRGLVAIQLLSSAKIGLAHAPNGWTHFAVSPRSLVETVVVARETLWVTYALNDITSILIGHHSFHCAVISYAIVWLGSIAIEVAAPFEPSATFARTCSSSDMQAHVSCVSGTIECGSFVRFSLLVVLQLVAVCASFVIAKAMAAYVSRRRPSPAAPRPSVFPVVVPAIVVHLLRCGDNSAFFDNMTCILAGLLPFRTRSGQRYILSLSLWRFFPLNDQHHSSVFRRPALHVETIGRASMTKASSTHLLRHPHPPPTGLAKSAQRYVAVVALAFLIASAMTSAVFFYVSQAKLSNDFLWEGFNTTGMHAYLMELYSQELLLAPVGSPPKLIELNATYLSGAYIGSSAVVYSSSLSAQTIQFEHVALTQAIEGLRTLNGCDLPWVAAQYCWVDFGKQWHVANSEARQARCDQSMAANGAVYMDAALRNVPWPSVQACWGDAIDIAVFQYLRQSNGGQAWVRSITDRTVWNAAAVEDEVELWRSFNVTGYVVQWQNYKALGATEVIRVHTALGMVYTLTIRASKGMYTIQHQTSMKMYWGWGNDLRAVAGNSSHLGGASLVRDSPTFAFQNQSGVRDALAHHQFLPLPLEPGLALFEQLVGPFGSVDLVHVPCPLSLNQWYKTFLSVDVAIRLRDGAVQAASVAASTLIVPIPVPRSWADSMAYSVGGDITCPTTPSAAERTMLGWFSVDSSCNSPYTETTEMSSDRTALALVAMGAVPGCTEPSRCAGRSVAPEDVCDGDDVCAEYVRPVREWVGQSMDAPSVEVLFNQARLVQADVEALGVSIVQYGMADLDDISTLQLLHLRLFDDPSFRLFAWYLVLDWVTGMREVVSFEGDVASMTVLTKWMPSATARPNDLEVPANVSYYCRLCVQYTTFVAFAVAFTTILYALASRCHIEGLNMLEINRVANIVWVGRPLLLLRSVVAILLLSTATLKLEFLPGARVTKLTSTDGLHHMQTLSTVLAGSETCWLVIVVSDLFMVITADYTNKYSMYTALLVTVGTVVLSVVDPVQPTLTLDRVCTAVQVDFQLHCVAGDVQIGSGRRVVELALLTLCTAGVCFVVDKWLLRPNFRLPPHNESLLLPAGAHFLYNKGPWIYRGTLFLDKASAFMCGLVSLTHRDAIYVLDMKTWRLHTLSVDKGFDPRMLSTLQYDQDRIANAVPLVE